MTLTLDDHIHWWNYSSIQVMDIRLAVLEPGENTQRYQLPSHAFVYVLDGHASLQLDHKVYNLRRFHVLQGGRGAFLNIIAEERFEYYLILYKASLMLPASHPLMKRPLTDSPFQHQCVFLPEYPISLLRKLEDMYEHWANPDKLHQLQARTLFYQFVHALLSQMKQQGIAPVPPDLSAQVIHYMEQHYMEPITLQSLADLFDCSVSYLTKQFKSRVQQSPIRLLVTIRAQQAARMLKHADTPLQEIAELVGYPDAHTLSRSFKKIYGVTPTQYRAANSPKGSFIPDMPKARTRSALVATGSECYSFIDYDSHLHSSGGLTMVKTKRSSSIATAALLLCFTLILSACGGGATATNNTGTGKTVESGVSQQKPATASETSTAATQTYTDSRGTITIPAHPQRIVDLTGSAIGNLLVLGVKPVAATYDAMRNPYHKGMLEGIVDLGEGSNAEAILNLEPDLIITYDYLVENQYEALSQIAPVVSLKYGAANPQELLLEFGKLTGKEQEAQAWIDKWNAKIAEVKPQIQAVVGDHTVSILQPYSKGIYAWGNKAARGGEILYGEFGLKAPPLIEKELIDGKGTGASLSLEQLHEYAGDYVFTSNWGWDDGNPDVVYKSNVWKALPAVKNKHVYFIDADGSFFNDPISLEAQLQFIVDSLLNKSK
ncbi:AraC family transcriptional regulator [Paenibacillus barcinonensis]|uniref:AraC family transcriptional regulator n=1 Tax=Paenibacillus barcinonensis TaxID=198119 RepID=A0A2V4WBR2_PAEBA|nr:AraC family transcriptional regulator [Paenibacillus barcinonensis]PYE48877.1 iron complex transport system substrate-binding protein [Paenibacillus barcinonensis]QKS57707.1 AraC family transcriptional regulator [Paenibacillus barcinonensis]